MGITLFNRVSIIDQTGGLTPTVNLHALTPIIWETTDTGSFMELVARLYWQTEDTIKQLEKFDAICGLDEKQEAEYYELLAYQRTLEGIDTLKGPHSTSIKRSQLTGLLIPALKRQWVTTC